MLKRWLLYTGSVVAGLAAVGALLGAFVLALLWPTLPPLDALTDYQPKIPLRVVSADGDLLGEFGEERRAVIRIGEVPDVMKHAILSAEDERFYQHYEILSRPDGTRWELGRGAMGVTYKARDINLDTPVALKIINARFSSQPGARQRFSGWRRRKGTARGRSAPVFCPLMITLPEVGRSMAAISLSSVLFPAPEWPVMKAISPDSTASETPRIASCPPG